MVRSDSVRFSSVRFSSVRFSSVRFSSVSFESVRFGSVRFSSVRFGSVRFGSVRFGSVQFGLVRFGTVRYGTIRFGSIRFGLVRFVIHPVTSLCPARTHIHTSHTCNIHVTICRQIRTYSFAKCFLVIGIQPTKCSKNIYNKMVTHIVSQFRFLSKLYMCNRVNILSFLNNFLI